MGQRQCKSLAKYDQNNQLDQINSLISFFSQTIICIVLQYADRYFKIRQEILFNTKYISCTHPLLDQRLVCALYDPEPSVHYPIRIININTMDPTNRIKMLYGHYTHVTC